MMNKVLLRRVLLSMMCLFTINANGLEQEHYAAVETVVEAFKKNNHEMISDLVSYPLLREYPIPPIRSKKEFIKRFSEIFDDELISMILNSDLEKDWGAVGWRGIMLGRGQIWLNYDGKIIAINHQSEVEKNIKNSRIRYEKKTLHQSVKNYVEPVLEWETSQYRIRIDDLGENKYRYASWAVSKALSEKPDLILLNGEITFEGSAGNHHYTFLNGKYQYKCYINIIGEEGMPPGNLEVYENGELLLTERVVKDLRL